MTKLAAILKKNHIYQIDLARKLDIHPAQLNRIVKGLSQPRVTLAIKITRIINEILEDRGWHMPHSATDLKVEDVFSENE